MAIKSLIAYDYYKRLKDQKLMKRKLTAIVLLNVLMGLLFSCGEGVRLLPFPSSEIAGNSRSQFQEKNKIPYQPNILRFDNGKTKHQTKTQSDDQQKVNIDDALRLKKTSFHFLDRFDKSICLSGEVCFKSLLLINSKGSRAPPLFS